jgi:hypothetical protein
VEAVSKSNELSQVQVSSQDQDTNYQIAKLLALSLGARGERLDLDSLKSDFGVGFRSKTSEATLFRLDVARGDEGTRFQFRFGPDRSRPL